MLLTGTGSEILEPMLDNALEDARAFCREKHGDSPEMTLRNAMADSAEPALLLPSYVTFGLFELLKNAQGAHCRRVGADRLDDLPPIEVSFGVAEGWGHVSVRDFGGGLRGADEAEASIRFLYTTNPEREANYTYSRNFGAPFEGLGVGLPLAHMHAAFLGGGLQLASMPGEGVRAVLTFDVTGNRSDPLQRRVEEGEMDPGDCSTNGE